ncbi:anaerobic carbon-monoxide dehydrogenase catalytic subunit [Pseudothauera rhizosphaerae]|uniref:Carbon monoxide dehydrogenase n=1 Tax=Pseudothauera rhizosphaerae TaxID=2565932 RepID=A0A4S4B2R0_9RHOO|nr:carbon monoxide dehydrogenase [Pseudothauera rhizosphaerae]THF65191.1 carbon monoxide dehydrogenase [Pseudothauera rhizosphaerae]
MSEPTDTPPPAPDKKKWQRPVYPRKADVLAHTPDPNVRVMLRHMAERGMETVFDRFDTVTHCGHGLKGVCCQICNMGPCQITPRSPRGICGADEHVIVARNILRWIAAGVAAHGARGREVMLALKAAAAGRVDLPIRGEAKVRAVARAFRLDPEQGTTELAGQIADILLEDLSRTHPAAHRTLEAMAPPERIALWRSLDILPISAYHEVFEAYHRTGIGTDGDWRNLMQQLLRCGLAFAWSSVLGSAIAQDCLYGPPQRTRIDAGFGALDPDCVNIALHGHSPILPSAIVHAGESPELAALARSKGAQGIRFYGICCSGLSSLYRYGGVSPLTNAIGAELVLGTGALDAWVADVQDVYPSIMEVAKCFHTQVITTSDSGRLPGALHIGFDHANSNLGEVHHLAETIVRVGIDNFPLRRKANVFIPRTSIEAEVGFSIENILPEFGGADGLLRHLRAGTIRGIVNLVGCNNPKVVYEKAITDVADVLLAHDVIILTNGCASFPLLNLGYCRRAAAAKTGPALRALLEELDLPPVWHMGECLDNARASGLFRALADACGQPLKAMPFAFSSPEWSNEKGVGAALGFRLLGLDSYHCIPAPIAGSEAVQSFFEHDTTALLGGRMVVDTDPVALGATIVADLEARRRAIATQATAG